MNLLPQTFSTFLTNAAAAAQGACSQLLNFTPGSVIRSLLESCSSMAIWLQWRIYRLMQAIRAATCIGSDLDSWMADFSFTRLPGIAASGPVIFNRFTPTSPAFIPVGTVVQAASGTPSFTVYADPTNSLYSATLGGFTIPAGTASAPIYVACNTVGVVGNVAANTINSSASSVSFIDTVYNAVAFTNGVNAESDAAFLARFPLYFNSFACATDLAIGNAVLGIQTGLFYSIQENVNTSGATQYGNFVVTVDDGTGSPPTSLITAASNAINAIRPVSVTFTAQAPTLITAVVAISCSVQTGYVYGNMQTAIDTAVTAYINSLSLGVALNYNRLFQVIYDSTPGIASVNVLTVNGGTANIGGGPAQVVRAGTVTCS